MAIDPTRVRRFAHGSRVPGWDDAADLTKPPAVVPDAATTPVPDELRAEIEAYMARYPDFRSASIPALHAAQRLHGWCTPEGIEQAASVMRLTPAYLTAVATFYDMLETSPVGRKTIYVCTNISCSRPCLRSPSASPWGRPEPLTGRCLRGSDRASPASR